MEKIFSLFLASTLGVFSLTQVYAQTIDLASFTFATDFRAINNESGFTVSDFTFTNGTQSITNTNPTIDGFIDDQSYLVSDGKLFIDRFSGFGSNVATITVTADAGKDVQIDGLRLSHNNGLGAFNSDTLFAFSISNSSNTQQTSVQNLGASGGTKTASFDTSVIVAAGTSHTFNIFFNSGSTTSQHVLDNIVLVGSVVPEPATYAFSLGILTLVATFIRRRIQNN